MEINVFIIRVTTNYLLLVAYNEIGQPKAILFISEV